jgi:hypothetical protein
MGRSTSRARDPAHGLYQDQHFAHNPVSLAFDVADFLRNGQKTFFGWGVIGLPCERPRQRKDCCQLYVCYQIKYATLSLSIETAHQRSCAPCRVCSADSVTLEIENGVALFPKSRLCTVYQSRLLDETMDDSYRDSKDSLQNQWEQAIPALIHSAMLKRRGVCGG